MPFIARYWTTFGIFLVVFLYAAGNELFKRRLFAKVAPAAQPAQQPAPPIARFPITSGWWFIASTFFLQQSFNAVTCTGDSSLGRVLVVEPSTQCWGPSHLVSGVFAIFFFLGILGIQLRMVFYRASLEGGKVLAFMYLTDIFYSCMGPVSAVSPTAAASVMLVLTVIRQICICGPTIALREEMRWGFTFLFVVAFSTDLAVLHAAWLGPYTRRDSTGINPAVAVATLLLIINLGFILVWGFFKIAGSCGWLSLSPETKEPGKAAAVAFLFFMASVFLFFLLSALPPCAVGSGLQNGMCTSCAKDTCSGGHVCTKWFLGREGENCNQACERNGGLTCSDLGLLSCPMYTESKHATCVLNSAGLVCVTREDNSWAPAPYVLCVCGANAILSTSAPPPTPPHTHPRPSLPP